MYLLGYFLQALALVVDAVLFAAMIVIFARAVLSWVSPDPYNPVVRIITQLSEPLLYPVRKRVPYLGGVDLSPILVLLAIMFLRTFLVPSLNRIAFDLIGG